MKNTLILVNSWHDDSKNNCFMGSSSTLERKKISFHDTNPLKNNLNVTDIIYRQDPWIVEDPELEINHQLNFRR